MKKNREGVMRYKEVGVPMYMPIGGVPLPTCETINVTVEIDVIKGVNLYCDSGIR